MVELDSAALSQIRVELASLDPALQAKAFKRLTQAFAVSKLSTGISLQIIIFECFSEYGDLPVQMVIEALPYLVKIGRLKPLAILRDFRDRISKTRKPVVVFKFLLDFCRPDMATAISFAMKSKESDLILIFSDKEFARRNLRYLMVFIFAGVFSDDSKRRLGGNHERFQSLFLDFFPHLCEYDCLDEFSAESFLKNCSDEDLLAHPLAQLSTFEQLKIAQRRPKLVLNPRLKSHLIFAPFLCSVARIYRELMEFMEPEVFRDSVKKLSIQVQECQSGKGRLIIEPDFEEDPLDLERLFNLIVSKQQVSMFIMFVENYKNSLKMFEQPHVLPFLSALLHHCDPELQQRIFSLICHFAEKNEALVSDYVYFCMAAATRNIPDIPLTHCVETLTKLANNKNLRMDIVTILLTIHKYMPSCPSPLLALAKLAEVHSEVAKSVFTPVKHGELDVTIDFSCKDVSDDVFVAILQILKGVAVNIEDNEEALKLISHMFTENGIRLRKVISEVRVLVGNNVISHDAAATMLSAKVRTPNNTEGFEEYCRLLSMASIRDEDMTELEFVDYKAKYIKDLYELTAPESTVSRVAWEVLGDFQLDDLKTAVKSLEESPLGSRWKDLDVSDQDGYVKFLSKLINRECHEYPRPLYTAKTHGDVLPLLSSANTFKDQLTGRNNETWFWMATLPLSAAILQLTASSFKATGAVRLIKSCLLSVPPSESREDTLRLMASWRICISESFKVLVESKQNDILWARDQITQEGRTAIADKKESVDNVMMMLTVLAAVIENFVKKLDDQKQAAEVSRAQMPWLVSVFELVATRLPKEQKALREARDKPIYETLTHSNKSSLFIAIFCTRLLYRIPWIQEYYGDITSLKLVPDNVFFTLFEDPSVSLKPEEVMDRKWTWISRWAYGADSMTAKHFEANHKEAIDEKTDKYDEISQLENPEDVEQFLKALTFIPLTESLKIQMQAKKNLVKLWNNGTEEVRKTIYKGIAEIALITGPSPLMQQLPVGRIPQTSVLNGVLQNFEDKSISHESLMLLLHCLVNHKRSDGRYLPPINWMQIVERTNWRDVDTFKNNSGHQECLLRLACEQNLSEVLFFFVNRKEPDLEMCLLMTEYMPTVAKLLPQDQLKTVAGKMIMYARTSKDNVTAQKLADAVASMTRNPVVRLVLINELPRLDRIIGLTDIILKSLKDPAEFHSTISPLFDLWLEARNGPHMNIHTIVNVHMAAPASIDSLCQRQTMLALISLEARVLSMKERYQKVLDVITASRIRRSSGGDMFPFLPLILSLIVSPCAEVDVPLCWFGNEENFLHLIFLAKKPFISAFLAALGSTEEMHRPIVHFLHPYISGPESQIYNLWDRQVAIDIVTRSFALSRSLARAESLTKPDDFWECLLPLP